MLLLEYCDHDENLNEIESKLKKIDEYFADLNKPNDYNPTSPKNIIVEYERNLESLIGLLETNKIHKPDELTLFEFYSRLKFIKEHIMKQTPKN